MLAPRKLKYVRPWVYEKQSSAIFSPVDCFGEPARYSLIEASTKTGKTVGCIAWLLEQAMLGKRNQNFWWVAPVYPQAMIAFKRMKHGLPANVFEANEGNMTITLVNGAVIWFKSGEKADNLFGEDVYAAVIDEASRMREESFFAVRSTLTATRGPMRIIGNVKGRRNWFFNLARRAESGTKNMSYHKILAYDAVAAGILDADEVADAKAMLPDSVFRELYLAEPSDDGGNPFGIKNIAKIVKPLTHKPVEVWGWDLAKSVDWTVGVGLDKNGDTAELERWQSPWSDTLVQIKKITGRKKALVDSTGVGDPIVELLQKDFGDNFEGFKFSPQSKQRIMEGLAVAIQQEKTSVIEGVHRLEMESFEYEYTRTGVRYSAPEGYHDDTVCAHALAISKFAGKPDIAIWEKLAG